jgi:glycine/D-amino acid oxidase-like deaminating enzyme
MAAPSLSWPPAGAHDRVGRPAGDTVEPWALTGRTTASEDFILDRQGPFVICSACSGHGAKFAPLTGEIAADLACGGAPPDRRFSLAAHS